MVHHTYAIGMWSRTTDAAADPPQAASPAAKGAIEPVAPSVPAEVVAALQQGDHESRARALVALADKSKDRDEISYYAYLRAIADRLSGRRNSARETLATALKANPAGRWTAKIRLELAGIELAAGNWAAAEELTRRRGHPPSGRAAKGPTRGRLFELRPENARIRRPAYSGRPQCGLRALGPGARARREPGAAPSYCSRWAKPA